MKNTYQVVKPAIEKIQHSIKSFEKLNFSFILSPNWINNSVQFWQFNF